ncbi:MAG: transporter [Aeromicrobium sp.]|nr:transporter [Aeromicrobium sp.]
MSAPTAPREKLWTGPYGRIVAGIFSLAFLVGFEALAVATVMPIVASDLHGLSLYALAFAAPTVVAVVSMTMAGPQTDRHGPRLALRGGVGIFVAGLVVAGMAPTMVVFLVGRAIQGFGMGFIGVGLYVAIGQVFPVHLRPRVFTVMTSAWVLPALVGPLIAGGIEALWGWRWVFLAVPVIAIGSLSLIWNALEGLDGDAESVGSQHSQRRRAAWSGLAAIGVLAISISGQRVIAWWPVLLIGGFTLTWTYAPRLLPVGTWRGRPGLPSVIATRSLINAGYFGVEAYVPLSLVVHRGLSATQAGLFLTSAAVLWFTGSWMAANLTALEAKPQRVRLGAIAVLVGLMSSFMTLGSTVPTAAVAVIWAIGGLGMGMATSTLGVLLLDLSATEEQGSNSAAMQISDSIAESLALAIGAVTFAMLLAVDATTAYVVVFALSIVFLVGALALTGRLMPRHEP